jgi:hypothetical protein
MSVELISKKAIKQEIQEMLRNLETYIEVAVDVRRGILAGGIMHADCEAVLTENGSKQEDIWGANWDAASKIIEFEALINIRPKLGNRKTEIQDPKLRTQIEKIVRNLLEIS